MRQNLLRFKQHTLLLMGLCAALLCLYCGGQEEPVEQEEKKTEQAAYCGDARVDPGEACDDGNVVAGDGCSAACKVEIPAIECGNSLLEAGEECDDGNQANDDGCSGTCQIELPVIVCGDGQLDDGEECDDGNQTDGDGCSASCQTECILDGIYRGTTSQGYLMELKVEAERIRQIRSEGEAVRLDCSGPLCPASVTRCFIADVDIAATQQGCAYELSTCEEECAGSCIDSSGQWNGQTATGTIRLDIEVTPICYLTTGEFSWDVSHVADTVLTPCPEE